MAEATATTDYVVREPYTHTPGVEDLAYPPKFDSEDAAYEWMAMRAVGRSNAAWELSWLLAQFAPADNEYGKGENHGRPDHDLSDDRVDSSQRAKAEKATKRRDDHPELKFEKHTTSLGLTDQGDSN